MKTADWSCIKFSVISSHFPGVSLGLPSCLPRAWCRPLWEQSGCLRERRGAVRWVLVFTGQGAAYAAWRHKFRGQSCCRSWKALSAPTPAAPLCPQHGQDPCVCQMIGQSCVSLCKSSLPELEIATHLCCGTVRPRVYCVGTEMFPSMLFSLWKLSGDTPQEPKLRHQEFTHLYPNHWFIICSLPGVALWVMLLMTAFFLILALRKCKEDRVGFAACLASVPDWTAITLGNNLSWLLLSFLTFSWIPLL